MKTVKIYTDGACKDNPGPGGWAAILEYDSHRKEISGYEPEATNNRMELLAVIKAMKALNQPCQIQLFTDSQYVINGIGKHKKWAAKKNLPNRELWEQLGEVYKTGEHKLTAFKVPGHSGHPQNERCDKMARDAIKAGVAV